MHFIFLSRGRGKTLRQECPTCDKERGEGKGKTDIGPRMKNGCANLFASPSLLSGPNFFFFTKILSGRVIYLRLVKMTELDLLR